MRTRNGRRIAIAAVAGVVLLIGTLAWFGREHIRLALALECLGRNAQGYPGYPWRRSDGDDGNPSARVLNVVRYSTAGTRHVSSSSL